MSIEGSGFNLAFVLFNVLITIAIYRIFIIKIDMLIFVCLKLISCVRLVEAHKTNSTNSSEIALARSAIQYDKQCLELRAEV